VHRLILAALVPTALLAGAPALAGGAPSLHVQEMAAKGADNPGPYIRAINRRGPMLATCFGSREAMQASEPFEAFLEVGKDGLPKLVNLQAVRDGSNPELDACLLSQLDKARFPEAEKKVEVSVVLAPAPPPEKAADDE